MMGKILLPSSARPFYRPAQLVDAVRRALGFSTPIVAYAGRHAAASRHLYAVLRQWRHAAAARYRSHPTLGPRIGSHRLLGAAGQAGTEGNHPFVLGSRHDFDAARLLAGISSLTAGRGAIRRHSALAMADGRISHSRRAEFYPIDGVVRA